MPPSVEISCFTILIDRRIRQNELYRRGGAFARIRLDFSAMRRGVRDRETRGVRVEDKEKKSALRSVSRSLHLPLSRSPAPRHPHTRFTSVRKPTPVGPTAR